jgi:hypothetical protein
VIWFERPGDVATKPAGAFRLARPAGDDDVSYDEGLRGKRRYRDPEPSVMHSSIVA